MKIDISATNYASMSASFDQNRPAKALHPDGPDSLADGTSAVVSLSNSGKLAAQAVTPPSSSSSSEATDHPDVYLEKLLVEMLSARKILGVSAADLQAVRESGANSDLLLKRIEMAALRAGFGIERQIPQENVSVDQTTFQAKGVIRTAHGS